VGERLGDVWECRGGAAGEIGGVDESIGGGVGEYVGQVGENVEALYMGAREDESADKALKLIDGLAVFRLCKLS